MTTIDRLRAVVHAKPDDWQAMLILADALEDSGDYIGANGARWQAENKRRPKTGYVAGYFGWWGAATAFTPDEISGQVWEQLDCHFDDLQRAKWKWYPSIESAESALAHALHALGITAGVSAS